ncbi:hypothetical protein JZ751_006119 [Albula glossodonta]|uniref:Neurotransmitter-gated ion-channel ligand-binding domain-containing protein n=1 Tax=Albula glossodonta TaxID=121402 RepID=A0A8T2PC34_9TELE|nr:hypothetical protein JZ751_006119 [Albula glossodonta]
MERNRRVLKSAHGAWRSADERFDATFHTNVLVNASGYCQYIPPGILKSTCYIDVRWFPFDVQKCNLKFGSWTYNGWLLDLQMLAVDISTYIPNGEWDLVGGQVQMADLAEISPISANDRAAGR